MEHEHHMEGMPGHPEGMREHHGLPPQTKHGKGAKPYDASGSYARNKVVMDTHGFDMLAGEAIERSRKSAEGGKKPSV